MIERPRPQVPIASTRELQATGRRSPSWPFLGNRVGNTRRRRLDLRLDAGWDFVPLGLYDPRRLRVQILHPIVAVTLRGPINASFSGLILNEERPSQA